MNEQGMYVRVDREAGDSLIQIVGDLDGHLGAKVAEAIDQCRKSDSFITVDLRQVSSISISGVSNLLSVSRGGTAEDVSYILQSNTEELMKMLIAWWEGVTQHCLSGGAGLKSPRSDRVSPAQPMASSAGE